jgi:hypothetical protein
VGGTTTLSIAQRALSSASESVASLRNCQQCPASGLLHAHATRTQPAHARAHRS